MTITIEKRRPGRPPGTGFKIPPAKIASLSAQGLTYKEISKQLGIGITAIVALMKQAKDHTLQTAEERLKRFNDACRSFEPRAMALLDQFEPVLGTQVILDRTGQEPLRFAGSLLREMSTDRHGKDPEKRHAHWWVIRIYRVDRFPEVTTPESGIYAVAIEYTADRKTGLFTQHQAKFTDNPAGEITAYNPLAVLSGYPDDPKFAKRQLFLEKQCEAQFARLVTEVLRNPL